MKGYKKKQGGELQRKVLRSLIIAGTAYACTFGGDNSVWAQDYNSDETLEVGNTGNVTQWETYDNVIIDKNNSDDSFNGIYLHMAGVNKQLKVNGKIDIEITDDASNASTHSYTGLDIYGGKIMAADGFNVTIDSTAAAGSGNKYGIYENVGDMILGKDSHITIDTKIGDAYGIFVEDGYGDTVLLGGKLQIDINQNNENTATEKAYGYYTKPNPNTDFAFEEVNIAVKSLNEAGGMYIETAGGNHNTYGKVWYHNNGDTFVKPYAGTENKKLVIKAEAVNGVAFGVRTVAVSDGNDINSLLFSEDANITAAGKTEAYGFDIGSSFDVEIGQALDIDVAAEDKAIGMQMCGNARYYDSNSFKSSGVNTIKATATEGTAKGIYVFTGIGDEYNNPCYGSSSVDMGDGTVNVEAVGKTGAYGIEIGGPSGSSGTFGDAVVTATAASGNAYGVYSHENNATVTFNEGLKVNADAVNGTAYALKADDGSTITTSKTTTDAVQLIGDLSVQNAGKLNVFLNTADSFPSGSSKKDNNANSKLNLAFAAGSKWQMTGSSQVDDLTVGKGTVIDMSGDKGANSTLSVENLKGSGAEFIMDVNKDGHDALLVNTSSENGNHTVNLNVENTEALKQLAASDTALFSTANAETKFTVGELFGHGLYEYSADLQSKVGDDGKIQWYVANAKSRISNAVLELANTDQVAYTAWIDGNGTLRQRLGELQSGADNGVWARMFGGKLGGDEFTNKYKTYQLGYDAQAGDWRVGAAYEYSDGSLNYTSGSGENKIGAVSLYGTLQGKDNSILDIVVKRGRIYGDVDGYGKYSDQGDYSTDATSIGVEYTKRFNGGNNVYFEPQAQLTFGRIDGYDYVSAKGIRVAYDDINSLIGRLGIVAGKAFSRGDVYVKASLLHEFSGDSSVTMLAANGESYSADKDYGDTWLEAGIGGNITLGKNCELYGDVERSFGGDVTKNWGANVGFRYSF